VGPPRNPGKPYSERLPHRGKYVLRLAIDNINLLKLKKSYPALED
jgi:hypothetical protein